MRVDSGKLRIRKTGSFALSGEAARPVGHLVSGRDPEHRMPWSRRYGDRACAFFCRSRYSGYDVQEYVKSCVTQGTAPTFHANGIAPNLTSTKSKQIYEWLNVRSSSLSMKSGRWIIRASPDGLH